MRHLAGDRDGLTGPGAGLLLTQPEDERLYRKGDLVFYVAPDEFTNPYVVGVVARVWRSLSRPAVRRCLRRIDARLLEKLRGTLPGSACDRCKKPCPLFHVSDEEWNHVPKRWRAKVLCLACYREVRHKEIEA